MELSTSLPREVISEEIHSLCLDGGIQTCQSLSPRYQTKAVRERFRLLHGRSNRHHPDLTLIDTGLDCIHVSQISWRCGNVIARDVEVHLIAFGSVFEGVFFLVGEEESGARSRSSSHFTKGQVMG